MSRLLSPAPPLASTRVSHILPTVKCSSCAQLVPLSSLGEHICAPEPPQEQPRQDIPQLFLKEQRQQAQTASIPHAQPSEAISRPPPSFSTDHGVSHVPFPSISTPPPRQEDYMPGGESGMAGVGRRAFQAAAHAAFFAQHTHHQKDLSVGMQGRRANTPQFLDIAGASGRGTPPLSPNSTHSHSSSRSLSPLSPLSQSPIIHGDPAFNTRTPSPAQFTTTSASRIYSNASLKTPPPTNAPVSAASRLPFLQKYKNTIGQTPPTSPNREEHHDITPRADPNPPVSPTDSSHSSTGLAYDRDDAQDDTRTEHSGSSKSFEQNRASSSSRSAYSAVSGSRSTRDDLMPVSPRRSHTTPTSGPRGGTRGVPSPLGPSSPPAASAMRSISDAKNMRRGKEKELPKLRVCVKCDVKIDSGRWVRMDNGKGVLCEGCWKNLYLPKCRRCDKPIEQAAVFSSDGQLKGKYHRACFTCATCHTPFPDNSFYVHSGQPLCAFHYHEANRSLCAAPTCGKPIEGACAITYGGDRFHPGCLSCSQPDCEESLDEYWEMEGAMLCERHARIAGALSDYGTSEYGGEEADDVVAPLGMNHKKRERAQKRTTRLITLTGTGLGF